MTSTALAEHDHAEGEALDEESLPLRRVAACRWLGCRETLLELILVLDAETREVEEYIYLCSVHGPQFLRLFDEMTHPSRSSQPPQPDNEVW